MPWYTGPSNKIRRASLKDVVPVRERPVPMTWNSVPGWGVEAWAPMVMVMVKVREMTL